MKLLSIKFKNIHSLKGEHEVRFDEEPLASAGIFAITGSTGAGKSSLLDVISLALYNQIPRFNSKISKSDIHKLGSVVTHFTDEAWAEVTYQSKGTSYRSRWEISKTRNGTWRDYEMSIINLNTGLHLDKKKSEVPSANEDLIGLNYDQFSKSILLSQGEFSRFLKSKKSERSKLLEDITGTHIYRDIGAKAFELLKEKKQSMQLEKAKLDSILFLSSEDKAAKIKEIDQQRIELDKYIKSAESIIKQKEIKQIEIEYKEGDAQLIEEVTQLNKLIAEHKEDQVNYELHLALTPHAPDMKSLHTAKISKAEEEIHIRTHQENVAKHKAELNHAIEQMSKLVGKRLTTESFTHEMEAFEKKINAYDHDLSQLITKGRDIRIRVSDEAQKVSPDLSKQLTNKINPSEAIIVIDKRRSEIGDKETTSTKDLTTQKNQLQGKLDLTQQWVSLVNQMQKRIEQSQQLKEKNKILKIDSDKSESLIHKGSEAIAEIEKDISLKQEENEAAIAHASLEEHRSKLVNNEPCPLCGSKDHPYALHQAYQDAGKLSVVISNLKKKRQRIEADLMNASKDKSKIDGETAANAISIESINSEIDIITQEQSKLVLKEPALQKLDLINGADAIIKIENEISGIDTRLNHQQEINACHSILKNYQSLAQILKDYKTVSQEKKKLYQGEDVHKDANLIQDLYTSANTSLEREAALLEKSKTRQVELSELIKRLSASLSIPMKALGFSLIEDAQAGLLPVHEAKRIADVTEKIKYHKTTISTKKDALSVLKKKLSGHDIPKMPIQEIDQLLAHLNESIQETSKSLGSLEEQINQDNQKIEQHKEINKGIKSLEKENRKYELLNQYIGDAKGATFSNYAQELTLARLLTIANARLKTMNDRYVLKHGIDDEDLLVIDQYQGNSERVVRTLSGGESFIISLALALSLSDLASKSVSLESLFIDEGFGTLDPETLDMALSTLEKLQNDSGKTIGVISHVEALKDRMTTKIMINKNTQGYSEIVVTS